jgi:hypothetical protein
MTSFFDPILLGYRLVCEATGTLSPGIVTTDAQALVGVEWYSDTPDGEAVYLARQRARVKDALVGRTFSVEEGVKLLILPEDALSRPLTDAEDLARIITPEWAEEIASELRWDQTARGQAARRLPTPGEIASAEVPLPRIAQRARVRIATDKLTFRPDGVDRVVLTFSGLVASAVADLGGGRTAQVSPADVTVRLTSDVPRRFVVMVVDALHWSRPLRVEAA